MATEEIPKTQLAIRIQQAMDSENMSLQDAASAFNLTYEYARRVIRGMNVPSKSVLKLMCQHWKWDYDEMAVLRVQDLFRQKNGVVGAIAQEMSPEVEPFVRGWRLLEPAQKEILLAQLNMFVAGNRKHNRGGLKEVD